MKQLYLGHRVTTDTAWLAAAFCSLGLLVQVLLCSQQSLSGTLQTARMLQGWDVNRRTCLVTSELGGESSNAGRGKDGTWAGR